MRKLLLACLTLTACTTTYDTVIRNATIYDGSGKPPVRGDVAIKGDRINTIGIVSGHGTNEIDAHGMAVAPGFINMLSWATESLIADGRAMADVKQGVTLEIFGEGWSMGPLNDAMKEEIRKRQGDVKFDVNWTTLREYLDSLVARGISVNVASFVGATTVRIHVLGEADRPPNAEELEKMRALVRQAMEDTGRREVKRLERYMVVLETAAAAGPLLGLLGTVIGMIQVFSVISVSGAGQAGMLSGGIAQALIATVSGLILAVPALIIFNFLDARIEGMVTRIDEYSHLLLKRLSAMREGSDMELAEYEMRKQH